MTRIILTRHGETEWNLKGLVQGSMDSPLTPAGLAQAQKLAERLKLEPIKVVYTSHLGRAKATAEVLAEQFKVPLLECVEFGEISFGTWEGEAWQDLREKQPEGFASWEQSPHLYRFPAGESMGDVLTRAKPKLRQLCQAHPNDTICIVTHGITLKVLVTDLLGFTLADWQKSPWQANTALNIFEIDHTGNIVDIIVGDSTHIAQA